ncbi:2013_t:CDS:2, partial [Entrophospora sp. SA101]
SWRKKVKELELEVKKLKRKIKSVEEESAKQQKLFHPNAEEYKISISNSRSYFPVYQSNFEDICHSNGVYVDKTQWISKIVIRKAKYFVSRPRKFGKSLFLSTLAAFFLNKYHLFDDLYIQKCNLSLLIQGQNVLWSSTMAAFPVILLDFSRDIEYHKGKDLLEESLTDKLKEIGETYGVTVVGNSVKKAIRSLVQALAGLENNEWKQVVILIDEYDAPILKVLENNEKGFDAAKENQSILRLFFESLKALEEYIQFEFVTGISTFGYMSLFSGANDLEDVTIDELLNGAFGFTWEEIEHTASLFNQLSGDPNEIKDWYNGYLWDGNTFVYNPYSICMLAKHKVFKNYWVQRGSTSWLLKFINKNSNFKKFLDQQQVSLDLFGKTDIAQLKNSGTFNSSILFQVGYLTIVQYNKTEALITLEPPNKEVRQSFASDLWSSFSATNDVDAFDRLKKLSNDLQNSSIMKFWEDFNVILSSIPHFASAIAGKYEGYYQSLVHLTVHFIGVPFRSEDSGSIGRTDMWIETITHVFFIEFKKSDTKEYTMIKKVADKGLDQIYDRKYYKCFPNDNNKITVAVSCVFSTVTKQIACVLEQEFKCISGYVNKMECKELKL